MSLDPQPRGGREHFVSRVAVGDASSKNSTHYLTSHVFTEAALWRRGDAGKGPMSDRQAPLSLSLSVWGLKVNPTIRQRGTWSPSSSDGARPWTGAVASLARIPEHTFISFIHTLLELLVLNTWQLHKPLHDNWHKHARHLWQVVPVVLKAVLMDIVSKCCLCLYKYINVSRKETGKQMEY